MNSKINWVLQTDPQILKTLRRFPKQDTNRILEVLKSINNDPYSGDIQKIKGEENVWRRRIGSYRIFYEIYIKENTIYVFHAERRTSTTY